MPFRHRDRGLQQLWPTENVHRDPERRRIRHPQEVELDEASGMGSRGVKHPDARTVEAVTPAQPLTDADPHALTPEAAGLLAEGERDNHGCRRAIQMKKSAAGPSIPAPR